MTDSVTPPPSSDGRDPSDDRTAFERFHSLTKRLLAVAKTEINGTEDGSPKHQEDRSP